MSSYPDKGNIQIVLLWEDPTPPCVLLQREEIVLNENAYAVAESLRTLPEAFRVHLAIDEDRVGGRVVTGLEASIVAHARWAGNPVGQQSQLAADLLGEFGAHLAPSPAWKFLPIKSLPDLRLSAEEVAHARIVRQSASPHEGDDGEALIDTVSGQVQVVQDRGYSRLAWVHRMPTG